MKIFVIQKRDDSLLKVWIFRRKYFEIETNPAHVHKDKALYPVGLANLGLTCYANAALEAFMGVDLFRRWLVAT